MTLQELHELTGKVLKERPELSNSELENLCSTRDIGAISYDSRIKSICFLDHVLDLTKGEEVLWKAN